MIDLRNTNTLWGSIIAETFSRLGLTTAIICPGSRSTPLTVAFAQHSEIETIPILDERSAAFFALGIAKRSSLPVVLICTSGTAGANFFPAIIEAKESQVPLLILTADRPPELRNCHAGQSIDQVKMYGNYPNWQTELAIPASDLGMLRYLRQNIVQAWQRSLLPSPGVVHLNIPFREPLAPTPEPLHCQLQAEDFFAGISNFSVAKNTFSLEITAQIKNYLSQWQKCDRGIIIAGIAQPQNPEEYCQIIGHLAKTLGWAVLAEGLSPVRNYANRNPYLISTYDSILRNREIAEKLSPEIVIQIGELPTSKTLRSWLENTQAYRFIIDSSSENLDPIHGKTTHLYLDVSQLQPIIDFRQTNVIKPENYLKTWYNAETQLRTKITRKLAATKTLFEGKIPWLLAQNLPPQTPIFVANSMPVRDVEYFWQPNHSQIIPYFNRGANGIDGTLSTALGIAHRNQSAVLLTGDLALLHDTNGFLTSNKFLGHLTIILINNQGGGIFEMLPISQFKNTFEEYFATPQNVDFAQLAASYGIEHQLITSWEQLQALLNPLPEKGIRILELQTDRQTDAKWRQENLAKFATDLVEKSPN
ncbi:2-succinyl-5-enolpyruvyl-6-hydroxy-3-cyclohexene-1-carboxylic-acid synthase [Oscillatoria salina]|uniref:2-succinyl-5-enolpyruvyl-6-hydroxy-3- cyclohexene-1-carboxylic-acid synthase n=1 Tax=Oscillatoria salina TaxID=331517 RepID=UPI001CC97521|nr:2-succinyl-5-enolpyruvyl-6-hydroxy-3-cyclohexene-1-carboxylic-acid synthase [Oscillatoria salina]MBZ8182836.1 2-succinyl-5-enolpyruvyl-6-hydroxy-3-cyclohexene-1-carboxylic-acid synthase [Oscillatoria salina IIICB1]